MSVAHELPAEGVNGVVEGVKGKAKEAIGVVTGRDDIQREGQAQQDKSDAQREAAKKEAEAESARSRRYRRQTRSRANFRRCINRRCDKLQFN